MRTNIYITRQYDDTLINLIIFLSKMANLLKCVALLTFLQGVKYTCLGSMPEDLSIILRNFIDSTSIAILAEIRKWILDVI